LNADSVGRNAPLKLGRLRRNQRAAASPTADLDVDIARQTARLDRLAAAVADAPDIGPLVAQLREANARLGELRERRAERAPARAAAPTMPSPERIRAYFDDLVSTLESDPVGARTSWLRASVPSAWCPPRAPTAWSSRWRKSALAKIAGAGFEPATFG
jgi:hypothetical protein